LKHFHQPVQTGEVLIESSKKEDLQMAKAIFCTENYRLLFFVLLFVSHSNLKEK
jgi:hypothetical protein